MTDSPTKTEQTVDALLAASGISPSPAERAIFVANYPTMRAAMNALYAIPDSRYAEPALVWRTLSE